VTTLELIKALEQVYVLHGDIQVCTQEGFMLAGMYATCGNAFPVEHDMPDIVAVIRTNE